MRLKLNFLSSKKIHKLSYGEVLNAETYNFRASPPAPVPWGLMCQRIFGPIRDYQCECGRFKGRKYRGTKCLNCGVDILSSYTRAKREGHIHLPFPVIHPLAVEWIAVLLKISTKQLKSVIYEGKSILFTPDDAGTLVVGSGGGSFHRGKIEVTDDVDLPVERSTCIGVHRIVSNVNAKQTLALEPEGTRRKRLLTSLLENSNGDPNVYFVHDILVTPPEYRPVVQVGGMWISSAKNDLYSRIISRKVSLAHILEFDPPLLIVKRELGLLQKAVDQLFVEGFRRRGIDYKSLVEGLSRKEGLLRWNLLGKRVDYSARSVITVGPDLGLDEIGLPLEMAYELFAPFVLGYLRDYVVTSYKQAMEAYKERSEDALNALDEVIRDHRVLMNRHPTLHKFGIQSFKVKLHSGKSIRVNPLVCAGFNADFDGDQAAIHLPLSTQALQEAKDLMSPVNNFLYPLDSSIVPLPSREMIVGLYVMTHYDNTRFIQRFEEFCDSLPPARKRLDLLQRFKSSEHLEYLYQVGKIKVNEPILLFEDDQWKETCLGRIWISRLLGVPVEEALTLKVLKRIVGQAFDVLSSEQLVEALVKMKDLSLEQVTKFGLTLAIKDFKIPEGRDLAFSDASAYAQEVESQHLSYDETHENIVRKWLETIEMLQKDFLKEAGPSNPLVLMSKTGARASMDQISQLVVAKGMISDLKGNILRTPIKQCYGEGLDMIGYFQSTKGGRKGLADKKFATPKSGYLARRLVTLVRDFYIVEEDCGSTDGILIPREDADGREVLEEKGRQVKVRSPVFCGSKGGFCVRCYGVDPATRQFPVMNSPVGIVAGQALSEPTTQMTMRTFHTSGAVKLGKSAKSIFSSASGTIIIKDEGEEYVRLVVGGKENIVHRFAKMLVKSGDEVDVGDLLATYVTSDLRQEDVVGKIPLLEVYYEMRKPLVEAVVSVDEGEVRLEAKQGGKIDIYVDEVLQGTSTRQPVFVASGERVRKGQFLSYGEANLKKYFKKCEGDLQLLASVFVPRMVKLYAEEGVECNRIHLEVILRGLTNTVLKPDGSYGLRSCREEGDIVLMGAIESSANHPSWLKAIGFGWVRKNLSQAAAMGLMTYDLPSERIITGGLLPEKGG